MGFKISPLLQETMCRIGAKLPFEEGSEELNQLLGISSNAKQIERVSHSYGSKLDRIDWNLACSQGVQLKMPYKEEIKKDKPIYCMADGSMLLTREDNWKEIKLGRIFTSDAHIEGISKERGMITDSVYCAHLGKSDEFWKQFSAKIPQSDKLVFIADGAKWLWNNIEDRYPNSTQILDYFHCKEHVCEFAKVYFKENSQKMNAFIEEVMANFMDKRVDEGMTKIRSLLCSQEHLQREKEKLLTYLTNNKKRIDYGRFKEQGLLIGSGPIEAANRDIIQKRLKLSGQRWTIEGAQQVANVRVALKSKEWHKIIALATSQIKAA